MISYSKLPKTLIRERLFTDVNIYNDISRVRLKDGEFIESKISRFSATTKALLFTMVDSRIKVLSRDTLPEVYSLPIVNMDWDQTQYLRKYLVQV